MLSDLVLSTTPKETAQRIANEWYEGLASMDLGEILEDHNCAEGFAALQEQLMANLPDHISDKMVSADEWVDTRDRLQRSLPTAALQDMFLRCGEYEDQRNNERVNAAFLFGVSVGRRLGGGR